MFSDKVMEMYHERIKSGQSHQKAIYFSLITDFNDMDRTELNDNIEEFVSFGYADREVRGFRLNDSFFN